MTGGVAVLLALVGFVLIVVGVRGTYTDVTAIVLHPAASKSSEPTSGTVETGGKGSEPTSGVVSTGGGRKWPGV